MYLFGLEASLNESTIFEEDFNIEAMSAVKGLRMINQGQIPGVSAVKITSANRSVIDTLNVSEQTKTKFRTSVDAGNIIYTASQQYTYGNFTGLVYIDLDPITGSAGYIIGEGLNGGYTVGNWPESWIKYWLSKNDIQDFKATIVMPTEGQEFKQGQKVSFSINYEGKVYFIYPVFWNETGFLDTSEPGTKPLFSHYGAQGDIVRRYVVKYGKRLGTQYTNQYDELIFKYAEEYQIPPALLKSLIYKESGAKFNPNSYRYEPCVDYNYFSGSTPTLGLNQHPYEHFRLAGYDAQGNPIAQDDQISTLSTDPLTMASSHTDYGLNTIDTDKNGTLTVEELWTQNDTVQHWSWFCTLSNKNFTAQVLLAASYGLTQMLYATAVEYDFDSKTEQGKPARNIYELFKEGVSIEMGARKLTNDGKDVPSVNTCIKDNENDWWVNLRNYNGGPGSADNPKAKKYATEVCGYYNSGLFNEQE